MSTAISFENVSKQYRLGQVGTGTLSHDLERWWARVRGKPDPFARVGDVNDREIAGGEYVWALKDIDLQVQQGEVLGIIGRNGAGKSTLLKLLSRITAPTGGWIHASGRIASLLEVGTGFHPELTGRENIYLNGAIMGMSRFEITRHLDEIVEFSGCGKYLDTPVKRYSSGMLVRLGFSVAAHLKCEILVVDEVLAVGDAEFQKRCIGKMRDVSQGSGRTVLIVSHNMGTIASLCTSAVLLEKGSISKVGAASEVVTTYADVATQAMNVFKPPKCIGNHLGRLHSAWTENASGKIGRAFSIEESFSVKMKYELLDDIPAPPYPNFHFFDEQGQYAFVSAGSEELPCRPGIYQATCTVPGSLLNDGIYRIGVALTARHNGIDICFWERDALTVTIAEDLIAAIDGQRSGYGGKMPGPVRPHLAWKVEQCHHME